MTKRSTLLTLLSLLQTLLLSQNTLPIRGQVVAERDGEPIIGATVRSVKAPQTGAVTDISGNFSLQVAPDDTLSIGFNPVERNVGRWLVEEGG